MQNLPGDVRSFNIVQPGLASIKVSLENVLMIEVICKLNVETIHGPNNANTYNYCWKVYKLNNNIWLGMGH